MLTSLVDINSKSFNHANINNFGEINCFFGTNGDGKSALANYIFDLDKFIFYLYHYICVMMKLGITEKDCCQDLGPELINNISNQFSTKIGY